MPADWGCAVDKGEQPGQPTALWIQRSTRQQTGKVQSEINQHNCELHSLLYSDFSCGLHTTELDCRGTTPVWMHKAAPSRATSNVVASNSS
jgi:hypothetical protein